MIDLSTVAGIAAAVITAGGGIYTTFRHIALGFAIKKEKYREDILLQAKKEMGKIESDLNEKIKRLEIELEVQKQSVSAEFALIKNTYNSEIKVLGQRIQELREDLQDQHQSMVALLTQLVNSR